VTSLDKLGAFQATLRNRRLWSPGSGWGRPRRSPSSNATTGAKRREWMGLGVAGMIIDSYCGSFPHSLRLAPTKILWIMNH